MKLIQCFCAACLIVGSLMLMSYGMAWWSYYAFSTGNAWLFFAPIAAVGVVTLTIGIYKAD